MKVHEGRGRAAERRGRAVRVRTDTWIVRPDVFARQSARMTRREDAPREQSIRTRADQTRSRIDALCPRDVQQFPRREQLE